MKQSVFCYMVLEKHLWQDYANMCQTWGIKLVTGDDAVIGLSTSLF